MVDEEYESDHERGYVEGERAAYRRILGECLKNLGDEDRGKDGWRLERLDTIAALRSLCAQLGSGANAWPDDLHLADVVSKYVEPFIDFAD